MQANQAASYMILSVLKMLLVLVGIVALFWCIRILCLRAQKAKEREGKVDLNNPLSPTLQWMNTAGSLLVAANKGDFHWMGGVCYPSKDRLPKDVQTTEKMLRDYWGIRDHESALEKMTSLLDSGMRWWYGQEMARLEALCHGCSEEQLIEAARQQNPKANEESFLPKMLTAYRRYGENALLGWDVGRVAYISQSCYFMGYLSMEEVLHLGVEAGRKAQAVFQNWEEMMESYLLGSQYWKREDADDPASLTVRRKKAFEALWRGEGAYEFIPYLSVDFETPLSKEVVTDAYGRMLR